MMDRKKAKKAVKHLEAAQQLMAGTHTANLIEPIRADLHRRVKLIKGLSND